MSGGRTAVFSRDGILRVRMRGGEMSASLLLEEGERGMPWWLSAMPVEVESGAGLRAVVSCLLPWRGSIGSSFGLSLEGWLERHVPSPATPSLRLVLSRLFEPSAGMEWEARMLGAEEDYGGPDEVPPDVLGRSLVEIAPCVTLIDSNREDPVLDAGNSRAIPLSTARMGGRIGVPVRAAPPTFSDLVSSALVPLLRTPARTRLEKPRSPAIGMNPMPS